MTTSAEPDAVAPSDGAEADGSPDVPEEVPEDVAARLVRALDRGLSTAVTLIDADMRTRWMSRSTTWVTGSDPRARVGRGSLERVHPDDVERIIHGLAQLDAMHGGSNASVPMMEPLRYRIRQADGSWMTMETIVENMLGDPEVRGLLLIGRPVGGPVDGVDHVVDLLTSEASLSEVLAACAGLMPSYLGSAAVVALVGGEAVVGAKAGSAAERLVSDERWWRTTLLEGRVRAPVDFAGFPEDLAAQARAEDARTAWIIPLLDGSTGEVVGCIAAWVRVEVEPNIGTDHSIRQIRRLAGLVIGEQRRHLALEREAMTDPLTGVGNRSALRRRLDAAAGPVAVALIDLDDFKPVNDTYGHDAGDGVLRLVADRLVGAVREDDTVVRMGGDEFAVVFAAGSPWSGAADAVARITRAIEEPFHVGQALAISVRASVGLARGAADEVVHMADAALYEAKRAKRLRAGPG